MLRGAILAGALAALTGAASADDPLTLVPAPGGCVSDVRGTSCRRAAVDATTLALSPDERHLYTGGAGGLAVLTRSRAAGTLRPRSCVAWTRRARCARAAGLENVMDLVVSPDGRHVYAASGGWIEGSEDDYPIDASDAVTAFVRRPATGALRAVTCLQSTARFRSKAGARREPGCRAGRALAGATAIAISPDGRSVYTAGWWTSGVAVFRRDRRTGALTQPRGRAGCVRTEADEGCAVVPMGEPRDVVVSPDGRFVYVIGEDAAGENGAVHVFAREARTGALRHRAAVLTGHDDSDLGAIAPDGRHLYVSSSEGLVVLERDAASGLVTLVAGVPVWEPDAGFITDLRVSADGASAVAASDRAVVALSRDPASGALSLVAQAPACTLPRQQLTRPFCMGTRESGTPDAVIAAPGFVYTAVGDGVEALASSGP